VSVMSVWRHILSLGINVMITIFGDFRQFTSKKIGIVL
jgi:hypothetical protein